MGRQTDGNLAGRSWELVFPGRRKQFFSPLVSTAAALSPLGSAAMSTAEVALHHLPVKESLAALPTSFGSSVLR